MLIKRLYAFVVINLLSVVVCAREPASPHKPSFRKVMIDIGSKHEGGVGSVAENLSSFGKDLGKFFKTAAAMSGIAIIIFSFIQYGKYRKNPIEMPVSKVIMTFIIGLSLIALSLVPMN